MKNKDEFKAWINEYKQLVFPEIKEDLSDKQLNWLVFQLTKGGCPAYGEGQAQAWQDHIDSTGIRLFSLLWDGIPRNPTEDDYI